MKFPKPLRHRGQGTAPVTIYKRTDHDRNYWRAGVKRECKSSMRDFWRYAREGRKAFADKPVADLFLLGRLRTSQGPA